MRKLFCFQMVSLDGCFEGPRHDLSWHNVDREFNVFALRQLNGVGTLLLGRKTYELFAGYWPVHTPKRGSDDARIAARMNAVPKVVVSRTLRKARWGPARIVRTNLAREIAALRKEPGKDIAVFGSSRLCVSLLEKGLIDELRIILNPVLVGGGTPLFDGLKKKASFTLLRTKKFASGNVLLTCRP